jgi:CBS domain-containing protein
VIGVASEDQSSFLQGVTISQVMSAPPISIDPDASVQEAARLMAEHKIGCLPVEEDRRVIGIVTETDVLRYFAGIPPEFDPVPDLMMIRSQSPPGSAPEDER